MTAIAAITAASNPAAWGASFELKVNSSKDSKFVNSNCKETQSCSLKSFDLHVEQYQVEVFHPTEGWTSYGTKMVASYQTDKNSNLESYGIAQFIQGCQYLSKLENGSVVRYPVVVREYKGKTIPYFHPAMVIDGFTPDPLSWSDNPKDPRHFAYFNKYPDREIKSSDYHGIKPASGNKLYVEDHPGVATFFADTNRAYNISLKFKTCIYRAADVPKTVENDSSDFAKPIHCFDWASSYVYGFDQGKFETLSELDPYCFSQVSNSESKK
ncbi:MAG: hypothetical protein ACJ763_05935, partial [Bdellovibrionia bacterium]